MKAARTMRDARREMIDHEGFLDAWKRFKACEKNIGLRARTTKARLILVISIYNLSLLGRVKDQDDVDAWVLEQYKAGGAVKDTL